MVPPPPEPEIRARVGTEPARCAVCDADDPRPYRSRMYAFEGHPFGLVRCARCGLVYVHPRPDGPTLARLYDDPDYYTEGYNLGVETENYFARREELLELYDGAVAELEGETGGRGRLFELGAAGGFLLEAARRRGWEVAGVELSPVAARYARDELHLDVFEGQLADAPWPAGSFDLAVADNVLEHTTDPLAVLRDLRRLLRPGGQLVVIVPSYVNSAFFRAFLTAGRLLPRRLLGRPLLRLLKLDDDHDGGPPYHVLEFDRPTLLHLLRKAGFEIRTAEGSVPLPAHLFKDPRPSVRARFLRGVFRSLDALMRRRLAPPARLRVLARRVE